MNYHFQHTKIKLTKNKQKLPSVKSAYVNYVICSFKQSIYWRLQMAITMHTYKMMLYKKQF